MYGLAYMFGACQVQGSLLDFIIQEERQKAVKSLCK